MATAIMIGNQGKHMTSDERMRKKLMESMLFWFDIKRQGCTNASMQQNPVLNDFSGKGRNGTCRNFAWEIGSGVGLYPTSFKDWTQPGLSINSYTALMSNAEEDRSHLYNDSGEGFTIQVKGMSGTGFRLEFGGGNIEPSSKSIYEDGVYSFPAYTTRSGFKLYKHNSSTTEANVFIYLLPENSDVIVSDGIDDFVTVMNIPELSDYTLIAKRIPIEQNVSRGGILCSNRYSGSYQDGAFVFENYNHYNLNQITTYSFDSIRSVSGTNIPDLISWQTKFSYNNLVTFSPKEDAKVSTVVNIFSNKTGNTGTYTFEHCKIALYSIILFDRTLSQEEIDYVKNNFMNDFPGGGV